MVSLVIIPVLTLLFSLFFRAGAGTAQEESGQRDARRLRVDFSAMTPFKQSYLQTHTRANTLQTQPFCYFLHIAEAALMHL